MSEQPGPLSRTGGTSPGAALKDAAFDDPIDVQSLLNTDERRLLSAAREMGCELVLLLPDGNALIGEVPTGLPAMLDKTPTGATPCEVTVGEQSYLCTTLFHDGQCLCTVACGPLGGREATRARVLRTAHFLLRLSEMLVLGGVRRSLAYRMHLANVEEAYCELQLVTQRLDQAIQRMKDSDRIKANFLATVSHELRTPLTSVLGYSEMLMDGLAGPLSDEQRDYLQTVLAKGEQLLQLISKLLDVSRIEAVGVQLMRSPVDLNELVQSILTVVEPQCRRKRLEISIDLAPELPMIDGDRDKLRQVLLNLIGNAIKFTPERGEVSVLARALPPSTSVPAGQVQLSVVDSGIGIPAHLHEKVFDAFYQVDSSATREYEGSGLGLSIVRKFVNAHGGRVWIENRAECGTVFNLTLPAVNTTRSRFDAGTADTLRSSERA